MTKLKDTTVTNIAQVYTVSAWKGKRIRIEDRKFYGLSFCTAGKITYTHGERTFVSEPGCAVILPQGATYELYNNEGGEFPIINFYCAEELTDEFIVIPLSREEEYLREYARLRSAFLMQSDRLNILSIFYRILSLIASEDSTGRGILTPAMEYIDENYCDPGISNEAIAQVSNVSEVYFRRLFRESFGTTPRQYILERRIALSRQLLNETQLSVTDIALRCGFSGVYHFCRVFKERTGITPTEYRTSHRLSGI